MLPTVLTEYLDLSEAQVDPDAHVLRNVVLIRAGLSLNRRHYSETVLQTAAPLFEGIPAYDSHERRARRVAETTGWYSGVRYENGALRADRHFSGTQAGRDVWAVAEAIVNGSAPKTLAGLSINAIGTSKTQKHSDGQDAQVIESITRAESVDDVGTPAAGGTYREAANGDALTEALLQAMTYEEFLEARPEFVERLRKELKKVRQDDALKMAEAEAERMNGALQEAQQTITRLEAEREAAVTEAETARRALAVENALSAVVLPTAWKDDLRVKLNEAAPDKWAAVIQTEKLKASSTPARTRVPVTGADQQVSPRAPEAKADPVLLARRRISEAKSPEELLLIQNQLER